jgi:serine/threonine protein kinase
MIGASLTHYRITAKLGEGGMGEVYRATDTKLGREVAIKVLPPSISQDAQSLARLEREAKALAALNHPHIAAIHGFEADRGTHFIVLELVEGQTLAERLRRGPLPLDETLRVARQIAEAVEAAHAKGIIHRDLKPGNVKITPEGRVKVLDFGLAKAIFPSPGLRPPSPHPMGRGQGEGNAADRDAVTVLAETTQPGVVLGTPAYMSPEQARGQEVDKRTDVWAFGCCLFECLSGKKPFAGETVTDMMAAVLKSEPDWSRLPVETPREVTTLLRRCLEKEPRRRLSSLGDIARVLEDSTPSRSQQLPVGVQMESKVPTSPPAKPSFWHRFGPAFAALLALALLGLAITGLAFWRTQMATNRASQIRSLAVLPFEVNTPDPKLAGLDKWIPVEIIAKLGQVTNLQVVNLPGKIEQLMSQKKSEDEIARELRVDGLVRGQLHGQGEAMTVYVSVVDAAGHTVGETRKLPAAVSRISEIPNQVGVAVVEEL